jgi:hypothetical protein
MRQATALAVLAGVWAAGMATAGAAGAQVTTPANCHWVTVPAQPDSIEMWCRGDDGRARPTGQMMKQAPPDTSDGCPSGQLYDGISCVSEAEAQAAAAEVWASTQWSAPAVAADPPPANRPRVMMFQDRKGKRGRGMACIDADDRTTVCKPIPHR